MTGLGKQREVISKLTVRQRKPLLYRLSILAVVFFICGVLLLFVSCSSNERENIQPETSSNLTIHTFTGGPRIFFEEDIIDLGTGTPDQRFYIEFHFQNIGDAPLVVYETTNEVLEGC